MILLCSSSQSVLLCLDGQSDSRRLRLDVFQRGLLLDAVPKAKPAIRVGRTNTAKEIVGGHFTKRDFGFVSRLCGVSSLHLKHPLTPLELRRLDRRNVQVSRRSPLRFEHSRPKPLYPLGSDKNRFGADTSSLPSKRVCCFPL